MTVHGPSQGMKGYKITGIRYLTRTQVLTAWKLLLRLRKPQTEVSALPAVLESTHFLEARWVCRTVVLASTNSHLPGRCTVFSVLFYHADNATRDVEHSETHFRTFCVYKSSSGLRPRPTASLISRRGSFVWDKVPGTWGWPLILM